MIARSYGFASWPRLKHHLDVVDTFRRDPDVASDADTDDLADQFCRLACLIYSPDDGPERWARAAANLLAEHPQIRRASMWAAAAAADPEAVRDLLAADPSLVHRQGGPHRWEPLFTLAYSRLGGGSPLETAQLLLDAGADPNAGYLWKGLPIPFTVLTGAFGEGEQGPGKQPRHPRSLALARLLLDAGADPNDGQTLYNRMFFPDNDHLELLFQYGLGTGDGGPWKARMGDTVQSPAEMVRMQLSWAIKSGFAARVRLLIDHGVDIRRPFTDLGRTYRDRRSPVQTASAQGYREIVDLLVAAGAPRPSASPAQELVAAFLAADKLAVTRLRAENPGLLEDVRPGLMVRAAATGNTEAVAIVAEAGIEVNELFEESTALHDAAWRGDIPILRALLAVGADPNVRDSRFDATPLGWAEHGHRPEAVDVLAPVTEPLAATWPAEGQ